MLPRIAATFLALCLATAAAQAETICTAFADAATGTVVKREGTGCANRVTPASTFKIPIALMGYDAGILIDAKRPNWPFKPQYAAWREEWKTDTDPSYWMKESVVWYSQEITTALGDERFRHYVDSFDYGNRDISGERGRHNGLTNAWLSSSLAISPLEQMAFLGRMLNGTLPVSAQAVAMTAAITAVGATANGWKVHGKTGMGFALDQAGKPVRDQPYGWFVGWATKGERTIVFVRLERDAARQETPTSWRARDAMLAALPPVLDALN